MATLRLKHNPSHMPDDELIRSFVVRQRDLAAILETVRENTGPSNQHLLILGPRGMGKTTLVNRAVAEIRRDNALNRLWYPILFDEESYTVTSAGELWFQALSHLADQTQDREIDRARRSLQHITDRARLRDASLARLLEFADAQKKRLLLVFENIDMIFDEQLTEDDAWDVRHTLQNEPRIAVLATSPTRLDSFHDSDKPLYELFREHALDRLDLEECRTVWQLITGSELPLNQARPIQIFTGGNTRLLTILATFAKDRSFRELMDDLVGLIDENTPYFKHNVEALPKESRKIFVTLAELWSPATARQVADQTRGDIRAVSAQLGRLQQQGIIEVAKRVDKTMMYQVAERMYNLYHLLRRRGSPRVRAVVEFIVRYYDQDGMQRLLASMATEAVGLDNDRREDHIRAYCELLRRLPDQQQRHEVIGHAPAQFLEIPDVALLLSELKTDPLDVPILEEPDLRMRLAESPADSVALHQLINILLSRGENDQALELLERSVLIDGGSLLAVSLTIRVLFSAPTITPESRVDYLRRLAARAKDGALELALSALALGLAVIGHDEEARELANEALERWPNNPLTGFLVGGVFSRLGHRGMALDAFTHAVDLDASSVEAVLSLVRLLVDDRKFQEAEDRLRSCL
ncbi:MAG TPA: ATP-binding protein, partial [Nannocystis sp.]